MVDVVNVYLPSSIKSTLHLSMIMKMHNLNKSWGTMQSMWMRTYIRTQMFALVTPLENTKVSMDFNAYIILCVIPMSTMSKVNTYEVKYMHVRRNNASFARPWVLFNQTICVWTIRVLLSLPLCFESPPSSGLNQVHMQRTPAGMAYL